MISSRPLIGPPINLKRLGMATKNKYKTFWPNLSNILPLGTKRRTGHESFQTTDSEGKIGNSIVHGI